MRRVPLTLAVLLALTVMALPRGAVASTDRYGHPHWRGVTEQGGKLKLNIYPTETDGLRLIWSWTYVITYYCEHGSEFTAPFSMNGWGFPIVNGPVRSVSGPSSGRGTSATTKREGLSGTSTATAIATAGS